MKIIIITILMIGGFSAFSQDSLVENEQKSAEQKKNHSAKKTGEPTLSESDGEDVSGELKEELIEEEQRDILAEFLIQEVIPAFGNLKHILLTAKPSFYLRFTGKETKLVECSLEFRVRQLKPMKYNIADIEIYDLQASAEIGESRWLFFKTVCGDQNAIMDTNHFNISFFVADTSFQQAPYNLRVKLLDQEQLDVKFWSLDVETVIENSEFEILVGPYGNVEIFNPSYAQYKNDESAYNIPLDQWPSLKGKLSFADQKNGVDVVLAHKTNIIKTIRISGSARLSFPTYLEDVKKDTEVKIPVEGRIFIPEEGEVIPVIDFSMR